MNYFLVALGILTLDQATKLFIKGVPALGFSGLPYGMSYPVLGDFFRITYIENPGMAFGIEPGGKIPLAAFSIIAAVILSIILWRLRASPSPLRWPLALILGGATGNLIDRMFYGVFYHEGPLFFGRVVDFLDVDFFHVKIFAFELHRWPVFNVADSAVSIGVVALAIVLARTKTHHDEVPL